MKKWNTGSQREGNFTKKLSLENLFGKNLKYMKDLVVQTHKKALQAKGQPSTKAFKCEYAWAQGIDVQFVWYGGTKRKLTEDEIKVWIYVVFFPI